MQAVKSKIIFAIVAYISCILLNTTTTKYLLQNAGIKIGAYYLLFFQQIFELTIIIICTSYGSKIPLLNCFPKFNFRIKYVIKIIPTLIVYLFTAGLNNKCLEVIPLSNYQIARSLTVLFNVLFSYIILNKKTHWISIIACLGVVCGFICGIEGKFTISTEGLIYGIGSSCFLSLYSIFIVKTVAVFDDNHFAMLQYLISMSSIVLFFIIIINGEISVIAEFKTLKIWALQMISGFSATVLNISAIILIKLTSPLTHSICGTIATSITTIIGFLSNDQQSISFLKIFGLIQIFGFSIAYAVNNKLQEPAPKLMAQNLNLLDSNENSGDSEFLFVLDSSDEPANEQ